ncbi:Dyp-type peroxidase [Dactylosporangium sp. McL0621]|uniref:Dyp-type peroxidase n=1 Tax=Dactylosporangium sp. McL0621 TaxID=3415678 RepID=UPI003CF698A6
MPGRVGRRALLTGGALALAGAGATAAVAAGRPGESTVDFGAQVVPFHGVHQAGIETPAQAHAAFVALDLRPGTDRAALGRVLRLLTDDAARLARGAPPLADGQPELAAVPARLTVTFGFGPDLFDAAGLAARRPESLRPLPAFGIDRLEPRWCGGDLLLQICADDPVTVSHAQRMLVKDARAFATVRWVQRGFRRGRGVQDDGVTQRNVLGQVDGTANPPPGTGVFAGAVWTDEGPGLAAGRRHDARAAPHPGRARDVGRGRHRRCRPRAGGTTLVLRRIRAELETWDAADTAGKEFAVGRRLADGAPLTGRREHDPLDLRARDAIGFPVIPEFAHAARAHVLDDRQRIFRRPYNYDEPPAADGTAEAGLIFASFQRDIARQFLPIQRNLAEADLLDEWITPIGSAVFAVPPGCAEGGWIGQTLLG